MKTRWLPTVEPELGCDAILYPYWPSPPFRRSGAPPAAIFVHDLAFRKRPQEVPWQQRAYLGTVLGPSLRQAAAVLVPSESTRRDLLDLYKIPGLESKVEVIAEGLPPDVPAGPLPAPLAAVTAKVYVAPLVSPGNPDWVAVAPTVILPPKEAVIV